MKLLFGLIIIFFARGSSATEYFCPESINTNQNISNSAADWAVINDSSPHYLDTALFTDGEPLEKVYLHPDEETEGKVFSATWNFQESSNIWLVCSYRITTVKLAKKIPANIKKCTVFYDKSKGVVVQNIKCM